MDGLSDLSDRFILPEPTSNSEPSWFGFLLIVGELSNTDRIMRDTFWVGVYPGMREGMIEFIIEKVRGFVRHSNL